MLPSMEASPVPTSVHLVCFLFYGLLAACITLSLCPASCIEPKAHFDSSRQLHDESTTTHLE
jgi:hypothetical protein